MFTATLLTHDSPELELETCEYSSTKEWMDSGIFTRWNTIQRCKRMHSYTQRHRRTLTDVILSERGQTPKSACSMSPFTQKSETGKLICNAGSQESGVSLGRKVVAQAGGEHAGASGERLTFDFFIWVVVPGCAHFVVTH